MFSPNKNSYMARQILDLARPKMNYGLMVINFDQVLINLPQSQFVFFSDMFALDNNKIHLLQYFLNLIKLMIEDIFFFVW